ncbi:MAG: ester cyclase [Pseudomonadota bacterium]
MTTLPITHVATTDLSEMLSPKGGQRMQLPGFDDEFVDFPDYIIRITDRIWHERKVDMIHQYYAANCIVHTQTGTVIGAQPVIDNTLATMEAYPDRVLDADNVIWSQDAPQPGSDNPVFYSSHLITSKMTNLGPSEFGPATGNKILVKTIADCACRDNGVFEEWLVRDYAAIVAQQGLDVPAVASDLARADVEAGLDLLAIHGQGIARVRNGEVPAPPTEVSPEAAPGAFAQHVFKAIWENQAWGALQDVYDFRVDGCYPCGRSLYGPDQLQPVLEDLLGALSDVKVSVDHVCDIGYLGEARDVAVRWSLAGKHTGISSYGAPIGHDLYLLGISQWRIMRGRIREDVTLWDDVALRRMIEGARLRG